MMLPTLDYYYDQKKHECAPTVPSVLRQQSTKKIKGMQFTYCHEIVQSAKEEWWSHIPTSFGQAMTAHVTKILIPPLIENERIFKGKKDYFRSWHHQSGAPLRCLWAALSAYRTVNTKQVNFQTVPHEMHILWHHGCQQEGTKKTSH